MDAITSEYLDRCGDGVVEIVAGRKSVEEVRRELWRWFEVVGIDRTHDKDGLDPGCVRRDHMELRNPIDAIQNCARWVRGRLVGGAFPAAELVFVKGEEEYGNMVRDRWHMVAKGCTAILSGSRMIAPKDDPIWEMFGDFSRPWGPFFKQELSGGRLMMMTRAVSRRESMELGIWERGMSLVPLSSAIAEKHGSPHYLAEAWRLDNEFTLPGEAQPMVMSRELWADVG